MILTTQLGVGGEGRWKGGHMQDLGKAMMTAKTNHKTQLNTSLSAAGWEWG